MFAEDGEFDLVESVERVPLDAPGLRPQRRGHAQLRRQRARHPQLDLRLPRRRHPEHPRLRGRLPRRARRQARAELPLDADDPGRRERGDLQQPRADGQAPVDGRGGGRPVRVREMADEHAEARFVTAEIERLVDEGVSRAEIAVFYRTNAQSRVLEDMLVRAQGRLPGDRRHEVLRAGRDQGRGRLPDVPGQPAGRGRRSRGSPTRRGAGSGRRRCRACSRTRTTMGHRRCGSAATRRRARPGDRGAEVARALHVDDGAAAASASTAARRSRELLAGAARARPATWRRWRPSGRSRPRAGWRTSRSSCASRASTTPTTPRAALGEFLQQIALLADADTIRDDEGLVTLMTLHNAKGLEFPIVFIIGMEDGTSSRTRARSRRATSRRSAGSPTSASPARCATSRSPTRAAAARSAARRRRRALALPGRDPARADRPAGARSRGLPGAGPRRVVGGRGARPAPRPGRRRAARLPHRRRRRPRHARRRRRDRRRAGRDRRRALRRRRLGAQADGRLRADRASADARRRPVEPARVRVSRLVERASPAPSIGRCHAQRLLFSPRAVVLVDTSFYAAITPLLPDLTDEFGLTKTGAGVLAAAYPVGHVRRRRCPAAGWPRASGVQPDRAARPGADDRSRASRSRSRTASCVLDIARFVQGVGGAASWAGAMAWLAGAAPREQRGADDRLRDGRRDRRRAARPGDRRRRPTSIGYRARVLHASAPSASC